LSKKINNTEFNKQFVEENNSEFYIGNEDKLFPIHKNTNIVLDGINKRSNIITLKNKGKRMYPPLNNNSKEIKTYKVIKQTRSSKISKHTNKVQRRKITFF
jgi:hypothetical protein